MTSERLVACLRQRVAREPELRRIRDLARGARARVWLVGGYVRDAALGRRSSDLDLVVTEGVPRLIGVLRECWDQRGFRFRKRGVITWRFSPAGRGVDLVVASRRGLHRDLARRELTINAMAHDLGEGGLADPFGGLRDLVRGRLRPPRAGVFEEDPVRALRLARFQAQFATFEISRNCLREARRVAPRLRRAPAGRVWPELDRLLGAEAPALGLRTLDRLALTDVLLPELAGMRHCVAGGDRPHVWTHTLAAISCSGSRCRLPGARWLADPVSRRILRWALLLHDISKPETFRRLDDGRPSFHGHEVRGERRADRLLRRLGAPRAARRRITRLIRHHLRPAQLAECGASERAIARLGRDLGEDLPLLGLHAACDARGSGPPQLQGRWPRLRELLQLLLDHHERMLLPEQQQLLDGREVMAATGLPPGPEVGRILARLRELQASGEIDCRATALRRLRELAGEPRD